MKETMVVGRSVAALPSVRPHKLLGEVPAPHRSACGVSGDRNRETDGHIYFFLHGVNCIARKTRAVYPLVTSVFFCCFFPG